MVAIQPQLQGEDPEGVASSVSSTWDTSCLLWRGVVHLDFQTDILQAAPAFSYQNHRLTVPSTQPFYYRMKAKWSFLKTVIVDA